MYLNTIFADIGITVAAFFYIITVKKEYRSGTYTTYSRWEMYLLMLVVSTKRLGMTAIARITILLVSVSELYSIARITRI